MNVLSDGEHIQIAGFYFTITDRTGDNLFHKNLNTELGVTVVTWNIDVKNMYGLVLNCQTCLMIK